MEDNRTEAEKYAAWVSAVSFCWEREWKCLGGWIFLSPSGSLHDLSAADLELLDSVESKNLFPADPSTVEYYSAYREQA